MKNLLKISVLLLLLLQLQILIAQTPVDPSEKFILKNEKVSFEFEPVNMGLASMKDLSSNHEHINSINGKHLLWEVVFARGQQIYTITNNYKPCSYASVETFPDGTKRAVMEWNRMRWWEEDDAVSVTVMVELPKDEGIAKWSIFVENNGDFWGLWSVLFPIVNGFPESGKYDIARPSFSRGGELITACDQKQRGRYPGSEWPMQMASFDTGGNSVYLAGMDGEARAKDFVIEPVKGLESLRYPVIYYGRRHRKFEPDPGERVYIEHYPEDMGVQGSDYPDHYPVAFGIHQGGWTEAAKIYRSWALDQKWTQKGALSNRIDIPESAINTGVWIRDKRHDAEEAPKQMNKALLEAAKKLDVPVGLHWYNWHAQAPDNLYPRSPTAKEGLKESVEALKEHNILVIPHIKGSSVKLNSSDFDQFEAHAVKDEANGLRFHYNSDKSGRLVSMCGNQAPWQDVTELRVEHIKKQYGLTGIFIDQVSGPFHQLCFDKTHLHPLGGGSYWTSGNRELLQKVKNVARSNGGEMVVSSESSGEVFLDMLDASLFRSQPSEREIPLMQMVYSGYTIFFGSTCDYTKSDNYFRYAQGQAFIDGRQNGWMDLGLFKAEYKDKLDYLKQCGKYRMNTLNYLVYGQLLDPVIPSKEIETFTDNGFGWGMYEQQHSAEVPCAEARLWKSEAGTLAIFFANYVDKKINFPYTINPGDYGLPQGKWQVKEISKESSKKVGKFTGILERTETLEPGRIKVIELIPLSKE